MILSVVVCVSSFIILVMLLKREKNSLGIPIAYLFTLLFIHVPGAIAHILGGEGLSDSTFTEIGILQTAIGAACFVVGVILSRGFDFQRRGLKLRQRPAKRRDFAIFCLVAGLGITYTLRLVVNIPSIGAVIEKAGGIWVLGVLLGLRSAIRRRSLRGIAVWLGALSIYPILTLLLGGFLSFGSTPVFIVLAGLVISTRSHWRIGVATPIVIVLFLNLFISYFINRNDIRDAVWGGEKLQSRIEQSSKIFTDFELFDSNNPRHLNALDQRLNQNMFVGMAANRIDQGHVNYLYGRSLMEGFLALVPRVIWPDKPVFAGSAEIITEMTGFAVNDTTSFGVGNVMEFYINFGASSVAVGFLLLGLLFGWLDKEAALAERRGDLGKCIILFMPAAAIIHPNGSIVELIGGGAASYLAALGWCWTWDHWTGRAAFQNHRKSGKVRRRSLRRENLAEPIKPPPTVD
jgi:hypothetical protein